VRRRLTAGLVLGIAIASAATAFAHSSSAAANEQGDLGSVVKRNLIQTRAVMDDLVACAGCSEASLRAETVALRAMKAINAVASDANHAEVNRARGAAFEGFRSYGEWAYSYGQSRYYSDLGQIRASAAQIRIAHRQLGKARSYARTATSLLHIRISRLP
jgi:hypothetical protein